MNMKDKGIAYALLIFGGCLGLHRFYIGKIGSGILYLLTGGVCGIGVLLDLFTLGEQVDSCNMRNQLANNAGAIDPSLTNAVLTNQAALANLLNQQAQQNQPPQQPYSRNTPQGVDKVKMLTDLNQLLYSGIITQEEFDAEKAKILNS